MSSSLKVTRGRETGKKRPVVSPGVAGREFIDDLLDRERVAHVTHARSLARNRIGDFTCRVNGTVTVGTRMLTARSLMPAVIVGPLLKLLAVAINRMRDAPPLPTP